MITDHTATDHTHLITFIDHEHKLVEMTLLASKLVAERELTAPIVARALEAIGPFDLRRLACYVAVANASRAN